MCNVYLCVRTEGNGFVISEDTAAVLGWRWSTMVWEEQARMSLLISK